MHSHNLLTRQLNICIYIVIFALLSLQLFINNEFVDSASGKTFATYNPATGKEIIQVSEGNKVGAVSDYKIYMYIYN